MSAGHKRFAHRMSGPGFSLGTWTCTCAHEQPGDEQGMDCAVINVVLRGAFVRHVGRRQITVDPTVAVLSRPGEIWRSSHPPGSDGDTGVYVLVAPERLRASERAKPLSGPSWLDWARLVHLRDADLAGELATALVAEMVDGEPLPAREPLYVTRARRILAELRRDPPSLDALADELHVSPWHLCRTFRAATGATPRAYAERLVLAEAVDQITSGRVDLATLAHDLGFSSHSHLTARFRAVFGGTPSALAKAARS